MTPDALVTRPAPANARTAERARALGLTVELLPLFAIRPIAWTPPDPARFDALLLTSANAVRLAGPGLDALRGLPVVAVGAETARAAAAHGLEVVGVGSGDARSALDRARGLGLDRLLHLCGRERTPGMPKAEPLVVYGADPIPVAADRILALEERGVVLLHSARAATRLAMLVDEHGARRSAIAVAALSPAVLAAAGEGWNRREAAPTPSDATLVELARDMTRGRA